MKVTFVFGYNIRTPSQQAFVLLLSVVFLSGKENIQNALIRPENKLSNKNVDMKFVSGITLYRYAQ
jgi:hypothetical protein